MGIEIERKFLINDIPFDLKRYPARSIEQGYLCLAPAIRVRRETEVLGGTRADESKNDANGEHFYMTYKGARPENEGDAIGKTEYNLPLTKDAYERLLQKADGTIIRKTRYLLPLNDDAYDADFLQTHADVAKKIADGEMKIELDAFETPASKGGDAPFMLAEVEFPTEEAARAYKGAAWFGDDVTADARYSNAHISQYGLSG